MNICIVQSLLRLPIQFSNRPHIESHADVIIPKVFPEHFPLKKKDMVLLAFFLENVVLLVSYYFYNRDNITNS